MRKLVQGASVPQHDTLEIIAALNEVAGTYDVDPAAIAGMIHTESVWDTRCVTNSYIGLTQVGPEIPKLMKISKAEFLDLSAADQIRAYGEWLSYYRFPQQTKKYGMNLAAHPVGRQAAVLQAMQFSPNPPAWKIAFAAGDYSKPVTRTKQADVLGDTSIHDMEEYYKKFFKKHAPVYDEMSLRAAVATKDGQHIADLIAQASDPHRLVSAQHTAAKLLLDYDGETYPHDGCAITLSVLLQNSGIAVADIYQAFSLGNKLRERGWQIISVGNQEPGDVGSTCRSAPHHGTDHIYLLLKNVNADEMVVADNQSEAPHFRWASGQGKSPTTFFLQAPQ